MNYHLRICPARVSRDRRRGLLQRLARSAPVLYLAVADGAVVLPDLCSRQPDALHRNPDLDFAGVHPRLLDLAPGNRRLVDESEPRIKVFLEGPIMSRAIAAILGGSAVLFVTTLLAAVPVEAPPAAKVITNSVGMKLAAIPAGKFLMGSPREEAERHDEEVQHEVTISRPFYMGVHEVSQRD